MPGAQGRRLWRREPESGMEQLCAALCRIQTCLLFARPGNGMEQLCAALYPFQVFRGYIPGICSVRTLCVIPRRAPPRTSAHELYRARTDADCAVRQQILKTAPSPTAHRYLHYGFTRGYSGASATRVRCPRLRRIELRLPQRRRGRVARDRADPGRRRWRHALLSTASRGRGR